MPNYLLEIGTEELPAGYIPDAIGQLETLLSSALKNANLTFDRLETMSTPRRLTAVVHGLAAAQDTVSKSVKGPRADKSFDADGKPTQAALGFAQKNNLKVEELEQEEIDGVKYLRANVTIQGKPAKEVLSEIAPKVISQMTGERLMRWGSLDMKFSRPIRWIVSLLEGEVVPFKIENIEVGRKSHGHRILSPGAVEISNTSTYVEQLKAAHVLVNPDERRQIIEQQVASVASELQGKPKQLKGSLLDEVVNITEWPCAVHGSFEKEYLDLPDALIETIMVHHQRYFPVQKASAVIEESSSVSAKVKNLLPHFITVANNDSKQASQKIRQGNERVLRARLADGRFFYFDDQKTKLSDRKDALNHLTFQEGLGSYQDKVERLLELASMVAKAANLDGNASDALSKAAELCKLDLVSNLVRELPELQGFVGAWYAEQEGHAPEVVTAIATHYSPRSTDDTIPHDTTGQLCSTIDKLDSLVGLFALGRRPSGSGDPFGLRRQAQGLIDIAATGLTDTPLNLTQLIDHLLDTFEPLLKNRKKGFDRAKILSDIRDFLIQRLRVKLLELGAGREIVDAVLSVGDPLANVQQVIWRCSALGDLMASSGGLDLVRAGVRVGNILKGDVTGELNEGALTEDAEKSLLEALKSFRGQWQSTESGTKLPNSKSEYGALLESMKPLHGAIDQFFEKVMVNDPDQAKRANRHALLKSIDNYFKSVGDFPKLQSLLV